MSRTTYHYGIRISPREHIPSDISPGQFSLDNSLPFAHSVGNYPGNYPGKLPEKITGGGNRSVLTTTADAATTEAASRC